MSKSAPYMHTDTYQSVVGRYIADWHGVLWISLLLVISYGYPVNFMLEQGFCSRWEDFESLDSLLLLNCVQIFRCYSMFRFFLFLGATNICVKIVKIHTGVPSTTFPTSPQQGIHWRMFLWGCWLLQTNRDDLLPFCSLYCVLWDTL